MAAWRATGNDSGVVAESLLESAWGESCGPSGAWETTSSVTRSPRRERRRR